MGSYNCIGFQSRLPVCPGDEIVLFFGLHTTPKRDGRYAFDPVEFAPGLNFTPIALPIVCLCKLPAMAPLYRRMAEWVEK